MFLSPAGPQESLIKDFEPPCGAENHAFPLILKVFEPGGAAGNILWNIFEPPCGAENHAFPLVLKVFRARRGRKNIL